jgi:hyperosmotically inducible periplasmic protein
MQRGFQLLSTMLVGFLVITATNGAEPAGAKKADNTATNAVDRDHSTTTPIDQSNDKDAIETTAAIRRAVLDDKSLSTSAHNVKIVTQGTTVTLRGAVASAAEKSRIEALAQKSAPGKKVLNELSIAG